MNLLCGVIDKPEADKKITGITEFRSLFMFSDKHLMSVNADLLVHEAAQRGEYLVVVEPGCYFKKKSDVENWVSTSNTLCEGQDGVTLVSLKQWKQQGKPSWAQLQANKVYVDLTDKVVLFDSAFDYVQHYVNRIWHINTEPIQPTLSCKSRVDSLFTPAAGLKSVVAAYHFSCSPSLEVVFYDYSQASLLFKQKMILDWDGVDYPDYVRNNLASGVLNFVGNDSDELDTYWKSVLEFFGGQAAFTCYWKLFCKLKHLFVVCDLMSEPDQDKLIALMSDKNVAVLISNIFFTPYAYYTAPPPLVQQLCDRWFDLLQANPCLVFETFSHTTRKGYLK